MGTESIAHGAEATMVFVFLLAAVEKITTLRRHTAAWHPALLTKPWRRRFATPLLTAALTTDLAIAVLLLWMPVIGAAVAIGALLSYSIAGLATHGSGLGNCQCFLGPLNTSTRMGLASRNAMLTLLALSVLILAPQTFSLTMASFLTASTLLVAISALGKLADGWVKSWTSVESREWDQGRDVSTG